MSWRASAAVAALTGLLAACGGPGSAAPAPSGSPAPGTPFARTVVTEASLGVPCTGLSVAAGGSARTDAGKATGPSGAAALPAIKLNCLTGGAAVKLSELRGPLVINAWASWCGPCATEIKYLLDARSVVGPKVRFLGIDLSDDPTDARAWMHFYSVDYPSLVDPTGSVRGPLRIPGPPVTFFIRSDGRIAEVHYGAFTSARQVQDAIAEHLGVT